MASITDKNIDEGQGNGQRKGVHGVWAEVRGIGTRLRAVGHHVVAIARCETTNNSWPQTAACFWSCVSVCVGVCCLLIKSRKTIKKITAYNLQTVMFSPLPSLYLHFLCLPACNTFTLGWSPLKSSVSFYFGKQRRERERQRKKGNKNCIRHLNGKTNRQTLCNPFQLP